MTAIIETERLILRAWKKEDADPYFQINQDPKVIEFLRGPLTMEQVNDFIPAVNVLSVHGWRSRLMFSYESYSYCFIAWAKSTSVLCCLAKTYPLLQHA